jgi:hypothetical protein
MSEPESQEVASQSNSVTNESANIASPTSATMSEETKLVTEAVKEKEEEEEEEEKAIVTTSTDIEEKSEEKTPVVVVTEIDVEEPVATPPTPQIVIVMEDGEQQQQQQPELAINGEIMIDEPQTPIPTISSAENLTTIEESETTTLPTDDESSSAHSTVTPESLNDDTKPIIMDESDFKGPVIDFYKNKNILMTGVTGFVGKAILWKLIQALRQDIGSIYILIRSGSMKRSKIGRPEERLRNEIFNNKVSGRISIF